MFGVVFFWILIFFLAPMIGHYYDKWSKYWSQMP